MGRDTRYYNPDLVFGMTVDEDNGIGQNVAAYTGSTSGTFRNNEKCSQYSSVTWLVDRKCHLISSSSVDKMCVDMKQMRDNMAGDLLAHGLVSWCGSSPPWQNKYSPLRELRLGSAPPKNSKRSRE